jgi:alkylhydroperoxidase family enzyme
VVDDWRSAPLRRELKATLAFLEKLTLRPDELTSADADDARAAGVSDQSLRDAATVCALFNMIVRLADSLGWDVPPWEVTRGPPCSRAATRSTRCADARRNVRGDT